MTLEMALDAGTESRSRREVRDQNPRLNSPSPIAEGG